MSWRKLCHRLEISRDKAKSEEEEDKQSKLPRGLMNFSVCRFVTHVHDRRGSLRVLHWAVGEKAVKMIELRWKANEERDAVVGAEVKNKGNIWTWQ